MATGAADRGCGSEELAAEIAAADVVVDACDNFESRFTVNAACWRAGTPLVSGAAMRWEGLVSVFDPRRDDSPCYRCLYNDASFACTLPMMPSNGARTPTCEHTSPSNPSSLYRQR